MYFGRELKYIVDQHGRDILHSQGMILSRNHIQHGNVSVFQHSLNVACLSLYLNRRFRVGANERALVRGGLLHDYFLYDWHDGNHRQIHGFTHPGCALKNAERDFTLCRLERDIIRRHMFPLTVIPPLCRESALVCIADKICAVYETLSISVVFTIDKKRRRG